jgi:hypothetical protein
MGADIAPGGLINLPFFDVDNVAQCLHSARYTVIPGQHLLAVFLLCGRQFGFAVQPGGFVLLTGFKACCSVRVVMVSSPLINGDMASCSSPALYGGDDRLRNRRRFLLLLSDLTLAGRAGGVIVYVREGDDREAGQESTGSSASVTEKAFAFPLRKGDHLLHDCMTA